jgi:hypothetical protein
VIESNSLVANVVAKFEAMDGAAARLQHERASNLHDVMVKAALYLTDRPPRPDRDTNRRRWDAITALAQSAVREAARIGVKMVEGPADFRTINDMKDGNLCVWLEVLDPRHGEVGGLSGEYQKWLRSPAAIREKQSFWQYIGCDDNEESVAYDRASKYLVHAKAGLWFDIDEHRVDTSRMNSFADSSSQRIEI